MRPQPDYSRGVRNNRKLNAEQERQVRFYHALWHWSIDSLCRKYGISRPTCYRIVKEEDSER